tara:strand:- start:41 stop:493 length:453 start_codon:yes stop_codon:yes gene_type:complete
MNINKILLILIFLLVQVLSFSSFSYSDEVTNENNQEEIINLDEEELPAIDPFQSSSAGAAGASQEGTSNAVNKEEGILEGLKLVGVIIGENKKIAVLSSKDGYAINFEENEKINENIEIQEIYTDHLLIKDSEENFFEVYMNDIIRSVEG